MINDKEEGLIDLMGRLLIYKGKQIDKSDNSKSERKRRRRDEMPEERNLRKVVKRSKRDKEKRKKKPVDKTAGFSTSSSSERGPMPEPIPIVIHPIEKKVVLSTPDH